MGCGCEKNSKSAINFFELAAFRGFSISLNNLGICYAEGEGVEKDLKKAASYYKQGAELGLALA